MNPASPQKKRETVYKEFSRVNGWKEALLVRYQHWRKLSVEANMTDAGSASYLNGRADQMEEIIELINNSARNAENYASDQ